MISAMRTPCKASKRPRSVIVVLTLATISGREFFKGVLSGIERERNWSIHLVQDGRSFTGSHVERAVADGVSGLILHDWISADTLAAIARSPLAVIQTSDPSSILRRRANTAFVVSDNRAIGRLGAGHLRECGQFNSFAFVSDADYRNSLWSRERAKAFSSCCGERVRRCTTAQDLNRFLSGLDKPAAVLADCDRAAVRVVERAGHLGIRIPEQLAILGVDNDEFLCESSTPTLSSIRTGHYDMGVAAIRRLDELLSGHRQIPKTTIVPPRSVVVRESTAYQAPSARLISRANAFIRDHACLGCKVSDVVCHLGVSRRLVELRYRQVEKISLRQAIEGKRLDEAKKLLKSTSATLQEVAVRSGFKTAFRLCNLFRRRFNCTPTEFRKVTNG